MKMFYLLGCNRTYFGNLGMTNHLELIRPKEERLPFVCELNFTAAGGVYGDIVQVNYILSFFLFLFDYVICLLFLGFR